ncbi:MAG: hypothetical protein JSR28_06860 [Proteobacteria bacterium]|nr:hypothetical protein [Pseudomonadota bacterium]
MKWNCVVAVAATLAVAASGFGSPALARSVRGGTGQALANAAATENLWHLRAGLNVAALSCRGSGREAIAPAYSRLLSRHRSLLASAYAVEQRRQGGGMDRHLTQLYNRFAMQRSPAEFCANAAAVATEANAMDSPTLARNAGTLLARLD